MKLIVTNFHALQICYLIVLTNRSFLYTFMHINKSMDTYKIEPTYFMVQCTRLHFKLNNLCQKKKTTSTHKSAASAHNFINNININDTKYTTKGHVIYLLINLFSI